MCIESQHIIIQKLVKMTTYEAYLLIEQKVSRSHFVYYSRFNSPSVSV